MAGGNENENSLPLPSKGYWTQGRGLAIEAILSHRVLDIACLLHGGSTANPPRVSAALDSAVFERFNKAVRPPSSAAMDELSDIRKGIWDVRDPKLGGFTPDGY